MENYRKYFKRITIIAQRYYNLHAQSGLTAQECHALRIVSCSQQICQQKLAELLGIDKAEVTRLINKLEAKNYITREVNPEDRRERLISSTPQADEVRAADKRWNEQFYSWLVSELPEEERLQFSHTLEKLFNRAVAERKNGYKEVEDFPCD